MKFAPENNTNWFFRNEYFEKSLSKNENESS